MQAYNELQLKYRDLTQALTIANIEEVLVDNINYIEEPGVYNVLTIFLYFENDVYPRSITVYQYGECFILNEACTIGKRLYNSLVLALNSYNIQHI